MRKKKVDFDFWLLVAKESIHNARSWLEDANHLLYEKNEYGHSLSLILFSIEETMKSWICFTVGVGNLNPSDEMVKKMFSSHPSKFETAIMWWMVLNIPLFQSSLRKEFSEGEVSELKKFFNSIDDNFDNFISHLVKLRTKGIYVDIIDEKKISTPNDVSKSEAEGYHYDAFKFVQYLEQAIKNYEEADPQEKEKRRLEMLTSTELMLENLEKVAAYGNDKEDGTP